MEYEYGLPSYQNKCTTEWSLLSFIHMQSQSNEHPLHNPSRTWPSLKTLQQCGLLYPTTALHDPLLFAEHSIRSPSSICYMSCAHPWKQLLMIINLPDRAWRVLKCHCQNSWQICWQRPTSDFPARIWTMMSSSEVLLSAASELWSWCSDNTAVCSFTEDGETPLSSVFSFTDVTPSAPTSDLRLSETACDKTGRTLIALKHSIHVFMFQFLSN